MPPGADGPRRRHASGHRHPAPLGQRHHRHHQGQHPLAALPLPSPPRWTPAPFWTWAGAEKLIGQGRHALLPAGRHPSPCVSRAALSPTRRLRPSWPTSRGKTWAHDYDEVVMEQIERESGRKRAAPALRVPARTRRTRCCCHAIDVVLESGTGLGLLAAAPAEAGLCPRRPPGRRDGGAGHCGPL